MYEIGNRVAYGAHGICTITALEKQLVNKTHITYYVLEPIGQTGCRYMVPAHNAAAMAKLRPILTPGALEKLLLHDSIRSVEWISDENQRKQLYRERITSGDPLELLRLVCMLYRHKKTQTQAGKKVHLADENFLRDAEKILIHEIAVVMEIPQEEAKAYLIRMLNRIL